MLGKFFGKVLFSVFIFLYMSFFVFGEEATPYDFKSSFKLFLSQENLDELGVYNVNDLNVSCAMDKDTYFCLFQNEKIILKVSKHGKVLIKVQAKEGQGPGEMIAPMTISFHGGELVVFDTTKNRLLFFNNNLEYLKEVRVPLGVEKMCSTADGEWIAWLSGDAYNFSLFSDTLVKMKEFGDFTEHVPYTGVYPFMLKRGFLSSHSAAITCWVFLKNECKAILYPLGKDNAPVEMKWKNPFIVKQSDVNDRTNIYECRWITKKGNKFIVFMCLQEKLKGNQQHEIIVFSEKGVLEKRMLVPFSVVPVFSIDDEFPIIASYDDSIWIEK